MDRQAHDYAAAAAIAFAQQQQQAAKIQQQQQFGFHHLYPQQVHGPSFLPPHPSLQQFPFHPHMQQQQIHPHPHHLLHLQQQQQAMPPFPPHLASPIAPSPFHNPFDSAPPPAAPPSDPELQKVIDKLVEYAAKNGPEFEAMIREKQRDNPAYSFLFGGEGHNYYNYKLWVSTRPSNVPFNSSFPSSSMVMTHLPPNSMMNTSMLNPPPLNTPASMLVPPQLHQLSFPSFYDKQQQQHFQPFIGQDRLGYEPSTKFKGLSGPLPSDVAAELSNVLSNLTGTKESIKGAKIWFMQRSPFAPALAEALRERVLALEDSERQLHIIYLANDILFDSLQRRINPRDLDNEALAFKPALGSMLARIYHNPQNKDANQLRLQKILQFWASKEVYDPDTIYALEGEMIGGPPAGSFSVPPKEFSGALADPTSVSGAAFSAGLSPQGLNSWLADKQQTTAATGSLDEEQLNKQVPPVMTMSAQQFHLNSGFPGLHAPVSSNPFVGSLPTTLPPSNQLPVTNSLPTTAVSTGEKLPPYPLFPPGLIPGMVRKMQIGSGVPYSPMSPLDIPTVIPPSTVSPSDILERVSKFFKEIGEVNPSEGPMKSSHSDDNNYERDSPVRKGGACIPPPPKLQMDPETGMYEDGSIDRKPGSSGSGRLGLGATADPNEVTQYDNVYSSYRKQRSTSYHSSMSARAATK